MIRFLRTRELTEELVNDELKERDTLHYYIANTILWTLFSYLGPYFAKFGWDLLFQIALDVIISIVGLVECFKANGGDAGRRFLVRAVCLSFPIALKVNLISTILGYGTYFIFFKAVDRTIFHDPERLYRIVAYLWGPATTAIFFWRLWYHFSLMKQLLTPNKTLQPTAGAGG